jgi:hypothetical protein
VTVDLGHHTTPIAATGTSKVLVSAGELAHAVYGWSLCEPNVGAAKIALHDGSAGTLTPLVVITLARNQSAADFLPNGIPITSKAIFLEVIEGHVEGAVFWE